MLIETRDGRSVNITTNQIVKFVRPVLGFEEYRHFAIFPAPDAPPFHWLQSIEDRGLAFPIVPAGELDVEYYPDTEAQHSLSAESARDLEYWVIVALPADGGQPRANLRAPVIVNRAKLVAAQIIMREEYPVRRDFAEEQRRDLVHA